MAKIPTGLSSFSSKSSKNQSTPTIFPVRVKYIFFNDKDYPTQWDDYGQYASIGSILFEEINNPGNKSLDSFSLARPLYSNIKLLPLINEIVYVMSLPDATFQFFL